MHMFIKKSTYTAMENNIRSLEEEVKRLQASLAKSTSENIGLNELVVELSARISALEAEKAEAKAKRSASASKAAKAKHAKEKLNKENK